MPNAQRNRQFFNSIGAQDDFSSRSQKSKPPPNRPPELEAKATWVLLVPSGMQLLSVC